MNFRNGFAKLAIVAATLTLGFCTAMVRCSSIFDGCDFDATLNLGVIDGSGAFVGGRVYDARVSW